jgi:hypothetical protein
MRTGYKELKPGVTVYRGANKYKGSCPIDIHPDSRKKPEVKETPKSYKDKSDKSSGTDRN